MAVPRLFVNAPLAVGADIPLTDAQARYLVAVLRLGAKARVLAFNGRDGEWGCELSLPVQKGGRLVCREQTRAQAAVPDLTLLFAPVKRHGTDLLAEKATELGARVLQPVITRRTNAETVRTDRLRAIVIEAAEQTERLDIPEVREPLPLAKLLDGWDAGRRIVFADEEGDAKPLLDVASALASGPLALLTGPEGGFDPEERRLLRGLPFVTPVSLGPRILRAETAAIAALALIQAAWGDWSGHRR